MSDACSASVSKKQKSHWSQGLLNSVSDPELVVEEDDVMVVIKDKYPKVMAIGQFTNAS